MHINVSRLIFDVENESSTVQGGENRKEREKGKKVGGWMLRLAQGVCVQDALGVRDLHAVPARYVVVLIKTRSPTTMVVPPVPTNWALFVFHEPDVKDERAIGLSAVRPPVVVIVSLTADVVSPLGVVVINSVQFVPSPDVPILTPITRGPCPVGVSRPDTITYSPAASTTVIATIRMGAITGDTAASSFRMMLFMVLSSCGLRRHLGTGEPTLLNVTRLIFDVEHESSTVHKEKIEWKEKGEEGWGLDAAPSPGRVRTGCPGSPRSARRTRSGTWSC